MGDTETEDQFEYALGSAVKSAKLGGRDYGKAVSFGGDDLDGEHFDAKTELGFAGLDEKRVPILFNHGMEIQQSNGKMYRNPRPIGEALLRRTDEGVIVEDVILYNAALYEKYLDKLGWSTAAPHASIIREPTAKGTYIAQWLIAEASLTPICAEPRNRIAAKSAQVDFDIDGDDSGADMQSLSILAAMASMAALQSTR